MQKTEQQNSILGELKKNLMGSGKKEKPTKKGTETATTKSPQKSPAEVTAASSTESVAMDNQMADAVAIALFLLFLTISSLPFE